MTMARKAKRKKARRTVLRSSRGKKLYAKRDRKGRFKDIQSYKRAHGADIRRKAKKER
jgi:DNA-binding protein HU-beta